MFEVLPSADLFGHFAFSSSLRDKLRAVNPLYFKVRPALSYLDWFWLQFICCPLVGDIRAMELLDLRPGMSLLVLGSRHGYLNILAGLILGRCAINHGIDSSEDRVSFSRRAAEEFVSRSPAVDKYDFCPPEFSSGDSLEPSAAGAAYDRVFCTREFSYDRSEETIKRLVREGGVLVFKRQGKLQKMTNSGHGEFIDTLHYTCGCEQEFSLRDGDKLTGLPSRNPPTLKEASRCLIRASIRQKMERESRFITVARTMRVLEEEFERSSSMYVYRPRLLPSENTPGHRVPLNISPEVRRLYEGTYQRQLSLYSKGMKEGIGSLPLPPLLKRYLHFH